MHLLGQPEALVPAHWGCGPGGLSRNTLGHLSVMYTYLSGRVHGGLTNDATPSRSTG